MPVARWADEWLAAYVGRAASTQLRARSALNAHGRTACATAGDGSASFALLATSESCLEG